MTQKERRLYLIRELLKEQPQYRETEIPEDEDGQRRLLRSLFNVRMPRPAARAFIEVQDAYLREEIRRKGITELADLRQVQEGVYLWKGDITTLRCDAIVNAANSQMLGCFVPCHGCIDNAIHTFAGVQLRLACAELMRAQGHEEEARQGKDHAGLQPALPLCPAYRRACRGRAAHAKGSGFVGFLLSLLPGACRTERHQKRCFLLYLYRGIPFSG